MSVPLDSVFDLGPSDGGPRRPGIPDVGGAVLENEAPEPPADGSMLHADMCNQWQKLLVAFGRALPICALRVSVSTHVPSITQASSPITSVVPATFSVIDNGAGDTTITWTAGTFPPSLCGPLAQRHLAAAGGGIDVETLTNGVRVRTWDVSNTLTDADFSLLIF